MSQRSQYNDRYTEEAKPKGVTRKGAGSAKLKTAAASSVYVQPEKSKQQKKAERKERERQERDKQERINKYLPDNNKVTSPKIKQYRTMWWVCLGGAILFTIASWFGRDYLPEWASYTALILAYAFIVGALYLDLGKIRKERNKVREEMTSMNTKSGKAERRAMKAEIREAKKKAEAEIKAEQKAEAEGKKSPGLFSRSTKKATEAADAVVEKQQAAKK